MHFTNLSYANLSCCNLSGSVLDASQLVNSLRGKSDWRQVDERLGLRSGYLPRHGKGTNFKGAHLNNTDFSGSDLSYADFTDASLSGANLSGAKIDDDLKEDLARLKSSGCY
jgi:uncharacterized protein YjbI with pentapeptide repeats